MISSTPFQFAKSIKSLMAFSLALSTTLSMSPLAFAGPGDVNSVNNGQVVQGGTYYNTAGDKTTFVNTGGGGLWIKAGSTVTGHEVSNVADPAGSLTGNGGHLHFYAPSSVVRVDGNINVSGLAGGGYATANGGRVTVDAAFYFQEGQISAFGNNGGVIQFNVGSAVFAPNSSIDARGLNGAGGQVNVQATDMVSFQKDAGRAAVINTSGQVVGTFDTNVINIEGSLVNTDGILTANGTVLGIESAEGGVVRIIAKGGGSDSVKTLIASSDQFATDAVDVNSHIDAISGNDGSITQGGTINANGANGTNNVDGADGGTVFLSAVEDINQNGVINAEGGDGGHGRNGNNPGVGGNGGNVVLKATNDITLNDEINASGGRGGSNRNSVNENNSDNGADIGHGQNATIADASALAGGDGGEGGFVGFQYGGTLNKNSHVYAKGGDGGTGAAAITRDTHNAAPQKTAAANATAIGGKGGTGGKGGAVTFDGPANPVGNAGTIYAQGGDGGTGGSATARAYAMALENGNGNRAETAFSTATATAGLGGEAGVGGTITAAAPASLNTRYRTQGGLEGNQGRALADSLAIGIRKAKATADATGNNGSSSQSIAMDIRRNRDVIADTTQLIDDLGGDNNTIFNKSANEVVTIINNEAPRFLVAVTEANDGVSTVGRNTGGDRVEAVNELDIVTRNSSRANNGTLGNTGEAVKLNDIINGQGDVDFTINEELGFALSSLLGSSDDSVEANFLSLFQDQRFRTSNVKKPSNGNGSPVVGYQTSNMFLVSNYQSVTDAILNLAQKEYAFQIAEGLTHEKALEATVAYLKEVGLDKETAVSLLEAIDQGQYNVNDPLKVALQLMAE